MLPLNEYLWHDFQVIQGLEIGNLYGDLAALNLKGCPRSAFLNVVIAGTAVIVAHLHLGSNGFPATPEQPQTLLTVGPEVYGSYPYSGVDLLTGVVSALQEVNSVLPCTEVLAPDLA